MIAPKSGPDEELFIFNGEKEQGSEKTVVAFLCVMFVLTSAAVFFGCYALWSVDTTRIVASIPSDDRIHLLKIIIRTIMFSLILLYLLKNILAFSHASKRKIVFYKQSFALIGFSGEPQVYQCRDFRSYKPYVPRSILDKLKNERLKPSDIKRIYGSSGCDCPYGFVLFNAGVETSVRIPVLTDSNWLSVDSWVTKRFTLSSG